MKSHARTKYWLVMLFVVTVIGYLLLVEHRHHVLPLLPYFILLLCPAMHIFMHRNHEACHHKREISAKESPSPTNKEKR